MSCPGYSWNVGARAAFAAAMLVVGGLNCEPAKAQTTAEANTLIIDLLRFAAVVPPFIAEEKGFASEAGITLKRNIARTPADSLANMVAGRADLSIINVGSIAQAI